MARLLVALCLFLTATAAIAEFPDRRPAISRNVDFYGSDLQSIFDTTLDACQAACLNTDQCAAFTFNQRSSACFLKGDVLQVEPYDGAISARITVTPPGIVALADARASDLGFLRSGEIARAHRVALDIGRQHSVDESSLRQLLDAAAARRDSGNTLGAYRLTGAVLSLTDAADLWVEYARLGRTVEGNDRVHRTARVRAIPAAINGYLRAQDASTQVAALLELARALEADGQGRTMIPALRLAQTLQPRRDTEALLEDAIGKYGFRVVDTQVESDAANPRICVRFNEELVQAGVDYDPYVQLPDPGLVVDVTGSQLCVDGVAHGARYRVVLREGLPAASGETLTRATDLALYIRDRSPAVSFPSRAYVLPRMGEIALPIETVNLSEVDLSLHRMTDRNLLRAVQDGLLGNPLSNFDADRLASDLAPEIWTGTVMVSGDLNRDALSRIPLTTQLATAPAGIYVLRAAVPGADPYDSPPATQWFVLTDLGLASWLGADGLTVMVRSLADAQAVAGAEVTLLSRGNAVLQVARADAAGVVRFDAGLTRGRGADAPAMVTAMLGDDLSYLTLTDPAFDLSDRGVEGRPPSPAIDVFLATDRGAYRAGETIHVTALMRDATVAAITDVPMTAVLTRPDGVEYLRMTSTQGVAGGHVFALPVAGTAPRGTWGVRVFADPDAPALASQNILVEDFLPERIDFDLDLPASARVGEPVAVDVAARYLFGPPAADLAVTGEALLRAATEVSGFAGYRFGRHDQPFDASLQTFDRTTTDAEGGAVLRTQVPQTTVARPLELAVTARVSEGSGRPVERQAVLPVRPAGPVIGIKPAFDGRLGEGAKAGFDLIGLDPDLRPVPLEVRWTVNRVRTRYQWYAIDGNWNWEPITTRERVATGTARLDDTPVRVAADVTWGEFEIIVERTDGTYAAASMDFTAGWYAAAQTNDTPDLLEASLDADSYAIGDEAVFRIVPRHAGVAVVTVMTNRLVALETVAVSEGENLIRLPVTEDWGAGAYVSASVVRPMDVDAGRNPARALGLGYAQVDPGAKALDVTLDAPDVMEPRQNLRVNVAVDGVAAGETAYVTLAAVDLGILNITGFTPPAPQEHYFGQRKLGVEMRDVYGRLIDGLNGAMGTVRSGGDAMAQVGMQSPPPTEDLVVFFQGPVMVGADGQATVDLDLPAFNGTLRLMAIAWSDSGVGQASRDVILRDPVVLTASVPRFVAPGDQSRMLLEIVHADGPTGAYGLRVISDGLALAAQVLPKTVDLAAGQKITLEMPFAAVDPGTPEITVILTTPDGRNLEKTLRVPVVVNDPEVSRMSRFTLAAGETFVFDRNVFAGLAPGTGQATLSVGPLARFDAPGLLSVLDRYPYGCTEQITSRAMPLLYLDGVATAMGLAERDEIDARITQAIAEVTANQAANGSFGLWRPASGDLWLDAYVTDFLSRARLAGHPVPDRAFATAIDQLRNQVNYYPDFDEGGADLAYALMVLAREGAAAVGDLRYYADEKADAITAPLGLAQLGAALALYGDQTRADALFARAVTRLGASVEDRSRSVWRSDYGTARRDAAGVLTLAVEAGSQAVDRRALLRNLGQQPGQASTQEAAWTLLAAHALIDDLQTAGVTIDGAAPAGPVVTVLDAQAADRATLVANDGGEPVDITVTTFGVPDQPEPAGGNGYAIARRYFTTDGEEVDPSAVAVGARLVTVLTVRPFGRQEARLMVNDPLPAGFEIDNPNLLSAGDIRALDWLDPVRGETAEFRSDRFLAAVDWRSDQAFRLAYIVRAVSPGRFHHPAASVEDMYRPQMRARTAAGEVVIAP